MNFGDITPGQFALVSGAPALITGKHRGGRACSGSGHHLEPPRVWIKTADSGPAGWWCSYREVEPFRLLEPVTTDGEFLGAMRALAELLGLQARLISDWADALDAMALPAAVTDPLYDASDRLAAAWAAAAQARRDFKNHFEAARAAASRGLAITGHDAP